MKEKFLITAVVALLLAACTHEPGFDSGNAGDATVKISFSVPVTRALPEGAVAAEYDIEKLRVVITRSQMPGFSDDVIVVNELKQVSPAASAVKFDVEVPVGKLNIYFIANESAAMNLGQLESASALSKVELDYAEDLPFDGTAGKSGVQFPFVMFSEYKSVVVDYYGAISHPSVVTDEGITIFNVGRAVAKLSVRINCSFDDLSGVKISPAGLELVNVPLFSYLVSREYPYSDPDDQFTNVGPSVYIKSTNWRDKTAGSNVTGLETIPGREFVFYLPEHIVGKDGMTNYSYLTLEVKREDAADPIFYHVPLGNGLGVSFSPSDFVEGEIPASVTPNDLTIKRNTHYDLTLNIKSLGGSVADKIEVQAAIKPWDIKTVDGSTNSPYLNISSVSVAVGTRNTVRIYFWSNQSSVAVDNFGKIGTPTGENFAVSTIFSNLIGGVGAANFSYTFDAATKSGTGWFDININPNVINLNKKYFIYLRAGLLQREIAVDVVYPLGGEDDFLYFDDGDSDRLKVGKWGATITAATPVTFSNILLFKFGSVVGSTYKKDAWDNTQMAFNPATTYFSGYDLIPSFGSDVGTGSNDWDNYNNASETEKDSYNVSGSMYHTGANIKVGKGDPCKLVGLTGLQTRGMTEDKLSQHKSGWRLPTDHEQEVFCGLIGAEGDYSNTNYPYYTGPYPGNTYQQVPGDLNNLGGARFPIGGGVFVTEMANRYFNTAGGYVPAIGRRNSTGAREETGIAGHYWSSVPNSGSYGYILYFDNNNVTPRASLNYSYSTPIRCVRVID